MPSIDENFLKKLKDDYKKYKCFIETGTYMGETIMHMEKLFDNLYTIEISDKYHNLVKQKYKRDKIKFILGDSGDVFLKLLPNLMTDSIFFLDGHNSGGDTGKGHKDCPLYEEVTSINNFFKKSAILIIDDYRLFGLDSSSGKLLEDWSDINKDKILSLLEKRITQVYHLDSELSKNDRLIIHIKAI